MMDKEHYQSHQPRLTKRGFPIIEVERSRFEMALEILAVIGLIYGLFTLLTAYAQLPEQMPSHFNFSGKPDQWSNKSMLWLLAGGMVFLYLLLSVLVRYPQYFNYPVKITAENAQRQYQLACQLITTLKVVLVWLFSWLIYASIRVGTGQDSSLHPVLMFGYLALIIVVTVTYFVAAFRAR